MANLTERLYYGISDYNYIYIWILCIIGFFLVFVKI